MYLKSLELHGFKSFPDRTLLTFEKGSTVIVGPNGSGKSNISDAMRWVLGELSSRNIRGTKMEDVIFGGTDLRRPMGYAEVSVTFDNSDKNQRINSDLEEIKVTRRYYRSGDSEYLINGKKCRLRDITDLFMNTGIGREGYSIVGQGRVSELLSKKSEDRRNVFEEAAGISKYRYRKELSEKKLAEISDNMDRLLDIFEELDRRLAPLTKDAEKARKYLDLREKKKAADVSLWLYDTQKILVDLERAREIYRISSHELETVEESLASLQAQDERLFSQMDVGRLASEQLLASINECRNRIHSLENEINVIESEIRHRGELSEQAAARIAEITQSQKNLSGETSTYKEKMETLTDEQKNLSDEQLGILADIQKITASIQRIERELEDSLVTLNKHQNATSDLKVNIDVLKRARTDDGTRTAALVEAIATCDEAGKKLEGEVTLCQKNAAGYTDRISELEAAAAHCDEQIDALRAEKDTIAEKIGKHRADKTALEESAAALRRMEEHFDGYGEAVRFLMKEYAAGNLTECGKIYGPLSQLISVSEEHVVAVETALGANLQHIVVDNEQTTKAAIRLLRDRRAGRATFYPVTAIRAGNEPEEVRACAKYRGYIDRADRLVSRDAEFDQVVEWLLSRTVVFDNLDHASEAARELRYRVKLVTLDGQVINAGGSYTGGALRDGRGSGMLSRGAEIEKKLNEAKAIADTVLALTKESVEKDRAIAELDLQRKDAEQQTELLRAMARAQLLALDSAKARLIANREQRETLEREQESLANREQLSEGEIVQLTRQLETHNKQITALREERAAKDGERNQLADERDAAQETVNGIRLRLAELAKEIEMTERLRENLDGRAADLAHEKESQQELIAGYEQTTVEMTRKKQENKAAVTAAEAELSTLTAKREEAESDVTAHNARLAEVREQLRRKQETKDRLVSSNAHNENKLHRLEEEQERLATRLWDDYEISYEDAVALDYPPITPENRSEAVAVQTSCRNGMRALEPINLGAIEEYKEVKERHEAMSVQVEDMKASYQKETDIIREMEEEMKTRFVAAFTQINSNFGVVFAELFGGGQAEIALTDPDDVLNCGIDIRAVPPGKVIKNMSLLSGGEQALVAIALFFAILKVNPTPFCIFDEIEAALDTVNVSRFGSYIQRMSGQTQYILITHRPGTMEIAERLYGVTMAERGVSRVLPMSPDEMEKMKKELQEDGVL